MNFYKWQIECGSHNKTAMDSARALPVNETIAEHRKHCKARKGHCPFEAKADNVDDLTAGSKLVKNQSDLSAIYEQEGVSSRLVDAVRTIHKGILDGSISPKRLPPDIFRNKEIEKIPTWMTYAYLVASNYPNDEKKVNEILTAFAKESGNYHENLRDDMIEEYGDPIGHGMESDVFYANPHTVVKASSLGMDTKDTLSKIERIMLGNIYFPETGYVPTALGKSPDGGLLFGLRQNLVNFKGTKPLTDKEISRWLGEKGWQLADPKEHSYVSKGWDLAGLDMHNENVVRDKRGRIFCIDPCVIPNTEKVGLFGYYDYGNPPKDIS